VNERLRAILVTPDSPIREVMQAIGRGSMEIALVVDANGRLLGTVSDGDIRRAILDGAELSDAVAPFMAKSPKVVTPSVDRGAVLELMRRHLLAQIPVVDESGVLIDLHIMQELIVPLSVPRLGENAHRYVRECLDTNFVSSVGPFVDRFEREFAAFVGVDDAVACASGTAALHVALLMAGAGPGSLVAVSDLTFIASANAIAYTGADILVVDSEPRTWNLDGQLLYEEVERRAKAGERVPAVIEVVHLLGHPADMEPIIALRDRFGITIVEDASEALGATYVGGVFAGRQVGSIGDIGCFSFNGNKILTTGGGGMIVSNDRAVADRARHLTTQAKLPGRGYVHDEIGFNYRLTNIAAALGVAQLEHLDAALAAKRGIASRYGEALAGLRCSPPPSEPWAESTYWLYTILLDENAPSRDTVLDELNASAVQARPIFPPIHLQPPYSKVERIGGDIAEDIHERGISLPSSVDLTSIDQEWVIQQVAAALAPVR